jgi:pimeloyl-ACP methyl ester carboxylesterase
MIREPKPAEAAQREAVLCLHCGGSSSSQWRALLAHLGERYETVAADLVGHGQSPPRPADEAPTLLGEVERLSERLATLPRPVHLVGHSFGGSVALKLALLQPGVVRTIALFEPTPFGMLWHSPAGRSALQGTLAISDAVAAALRDGDPERAAHMFHEHWQPGAWLPLPPHARQRLIERMPVVSQAFESQLGERTHPRELRCIGVPVLYMRGSEPHPSVAAIQQLLEANCPRLETQVFEGIAHMGPVTHGAIVNPRIEQFIERHGRGGAAHRGRRGADRPGLSRWRMCASCDALPAGVQCNSAPARGTGFRLRIRRGAPQAASVDLDRDGHRFTAADAERGDAAALSARA